MTREQIAKLVDDYDDGHITKGDLVAKMLDAYNDAYHVGFEAGINDDNLSDDEFIIDMEDDSEEEEKQ